MTFTRRLMFLAGQLGMMMMVRFFFSWNVKYADQPSETGQALFVATWVGVALLVGRLLDGLGDPVAGVLSDRWVRAGRQRRQLLWFSLVLPAIGLILFFTADHSMSSFVRWSLFLAGMLVFFTGYTFYAIPYWSLLEDYSGEDIKERRRLSNLLGAGLLLAVALVGVVTPGLVEAHGYLSTAVGVAGVGMVFMTLPYFAQPAGGPLCTPTTEQVAPIGRRMLAAFRHRRFVALLLLFSGSQMAFTTITVALPFVAENLLHGTERDVAKMMGPFLGAAIPFFLFGPFFSRRFGWQRTMVVASLVLAVVYAGTGALGEAVVGTPMTTAMLLFALGGPMAALLLGLEGEAITECAREAEGDVTSLYWGVFNLLVKALNGLAVFLSALWVSWSHEPGMRATATRGMAVMAGAFLVLGVIGYFAMRPPTDRVRDAG